MESVLIISCTKQSDEIFAELLSAADYSPIFTVRSCTEARQLISTQNFDLVIINAPLKDESGENLARELSGMGQSQVILLVRAENGDEIAAATEKYGVLTLARPVGRAAFSSVLKLTRAAQNRLKQIQRENDRLTQKIEDIRLIDRAKCILISHMGMSESEAHKYIERHAMDTRETKRVVAESILKTYEN